MFFTAPAASATNDIADDDEDEEEDESTREAPDRSHVVPPPAELPATRDEALDELHRRLQVMATRADRLERSIESLAPTRIAEIPTRAELRALEAVASANRERAQVLERQLADARDAETRAEAARAEDRLAQNDLAATVAKLETKLRDASEQLHDFREFKDSSGDLLGDLREQLLDRDAARAAEFSRRLAGAYTVAIVALLAALLTFALMLSK